jgi:hypothetical protein
MEGRDLFTHIRSGRGDYDVRAHLAEMIALLGAPPKMLINREICWSEVKWSHAVPNSKASFVRPHASITEGLFSTLKASLCTQI